MVATVDNFEKSKEYFKQGDILSTLDSFDKVIESIDRSKPKDKLRLIDFLNGLLTYCRENNLKKEEAFVLRALGRVHSKYKDHKEGLNYSYQAVKIHRGLGKKSDIADSLVFLAEDLEASGKFDECIKSYNEAADIYHEIGKRRKEKDIMKEISRLDQFSREEVEDEYIKHKFHIDDEY